MPSNKVKAYELQSKCVRYSVRIAQVTDNRGSFIRSKNDLAKQLADLKHELLVLRVQKIAGGAASKLTKMYVRSFICKDFETDLFVQQRRTQVRRTGTHRNQSESTSKPPRILQEKEIPSPGFTAEKNSCYSAAVD